MPFNLDVQTSTSAAQTMEAVLKHAATHRGLTGAHVDQVSRQLQMETLVQVMYSC